jgi:hypothetical protein
MCYVHYGDFTGYMCYVHYGDFTGYMCYVHYGDLTLRELDYIVIIPFGYILYCGGFKLFCNMCVCVCGWVL